MHSSTLAHLIEAWGSWAPALSPDARRVAFISDRRGHPELWIMDTDDGPATVRSFSEDPVVRVTWSADGQWLAAAVAIDGGVRTQCWALRPDGTDAHPLGLDPTRHMVLGPWTRRGHRIVVMSPPRSADDVSVCDLVDPDPSGRGREPLARGGLVNVLSLSEDERFALLRDGTRGAHFCVTLDRAEDHDHPLLPYPETGSTEHGLLRPAPAGDGLIAYLTTDAGRPRFMLAAVELGPDGVRGEVGIVAERDDGELEFFDADDAGRRLLLVWNVGGRSMVELLDPVSGERIAIDSLPGSVVTGCALARDGRSAVLSIEAHNTPQQLWRLDCDQLGWRQLTDSPLDPTPSN